MPSFYNTNGYTGVVNCGYAYKALLQHSEEIKFIIVVNQSYLTGSDCGELLKLFYSFLRLLDLNDDSRNKMKDSVVIAFNRLTKHQNYK